MGRQRSGHRDGACLSGGQQTVRQAGVACLQQEEPGRLLQLLF